MRYNMDDKNYFEKQGLTTIHKFFEYAQNQINYGQIDQNGNKHNGVNDAETYRLQSPLELLKSHIGICWDVTELNRSFFENMTSLKYETYYLFYDDNKGCPSHSILVYYDNHKVYWFEPMFTDEECYYSGIHEYNNISELLVDFKNIFMKYALHTKMIQSDYDINRLNLYQYCKPNYDINGFEMRQHINNSTFIDTNIL